jgi:hypothetical protein
MSATIDVPKDVLTRIITDDYSRRQKLMYSIEGGELIDYGFVRVDGLHVFDPVSPMENKWRIIKPTVDFLGMMGTNNGFVVIVTERGKVWSGLMPHFTNDGVDGLNYVRSRNWDDLLRRLCPNSQGKDEGWGVASIVYNSTANMFHSWELLHRMREPNWVAPPWPDDNK